MKMKKFLLGLLAFVLVGQAVSAHDLKDYTHWSLSVSGGISQFDGDVAQDYNKMFSASHIRWVVGLEAEYSWNPYWGLMLQCHYIPYMGKTTGSYGSNTFSGYSIDPALLASLNVLNLFGPYRHDKHWGLYLNAGIGMAFYGVESKPTEGEDQTGASKTPTDFKDGRSLVFPFGANVEYNINDYLAVGLAGYYRVHNKDNFEGEDYVRGTSNDAMFTLTANLRVKLAPNKKKAHVRNISMFDYHNNNSQQAADNSSSLDSIKQVLDEQEERISVLEDSLDRLKTEGVRTVPAEGAPVDNSCCQAFADSLNKLHDRLNDMEDKLAQALQEEGAGLGEPLDTIFFALNRFSLTPKARRCLAMVADSVKKLPDAKVSIVGYSDASGEPDYNQLMTERRVETVHKYLVKMGLDDSRIVDLPKGPYPSASAYDERMRRCELYIKQ